MPVYKKVNKDFFKKWTKDMAYVLGFFAADGYITVNKRGSNFWCIQITDGELLYKIKNCIKSEHKISKRIGKGSKKDSYRLQIGSFEMCDDLRRLGFKENKTKSMVIPHVPKKYFPDFVRGYFDGDGNVWVGLIHKERSKQSFSISCSFTSCSSDFLFILRARLKNLGLINGTIRKYKDNYYRLTYSILSSLKLYYFMYNESVSSDSSLLLERKRVVFEKFIKMRS